MPIEGGSTSGYVKGWNKFTAAGNGEAVQLVRRGDFNVSIWAAPGGTFTGTVVPERSFDYGATWLPFTFSDGVAVSWSAPISTVLPEPQLGIYWRLRVPTLTNGEINWQISQ